MDVEQIRTSQNRAAHLRIVDDEPAITVQPDTAVPDDKPRTAAGRYFRDQVYNYANPNSVVVNWRRRRAELFMNRLLRLPRLDRPLEILDVGGLHEYWSILGVPDPERFHITLLNLQPAPLPDVAPGFSSVVGDGRQLAYADDSFDVVFSNSVIEHLPDINDQRRFADEVQRVSVRHAIQTPSRWFPVEVHSCIPLFQFMPVGARAALMERYNVSWYPRGDTYEQSCEVAQSIRLLSARDMRAMFPGSEIVTERVAGFTKSYTAYGGW